MTDRDGKPMAQSDDATPKVFREQLQQYYNIHVL